MPLARQAMAACMARVGLNGPFAAAVEARPGCMPRAGQAYTEDTAAATIVKCTVATPAPTSISSNDNRMAPSQGPDVPCRDQSASNGLSSWQARGMSQSAGHMRHCSCPSCQHKQSSPFQLWHLAASLPLHGQRRTQLFRAHGAAPPSSTMPGGQRMACSANLGRAPPKKLVIEYDPEDVELYIQVADAIEAALPSVVVEGNEGSPGRAGSFEVTTPEGLLIFSRLKEKKMLGADALLERVLAHPRGLGDAADEKALPAMVCQ